MAKVHTGKGTMTKVKSNRIAIDRVNTVRGMVTISTVDEDSWLVKAPETAIRVAGGGWTVVQTYPNVEQARGGHRMLVEVSRLDPIILSKLVAITGDSV